MSRDILDSHGQLLALVYEVINNNDWSGEERIILTQIHSGIGVRYVDQLPGISLEEDYKIAYAAKEDHRWDKDRRTRTSLGRYIRRQLKVSISDELLDTFCNYVWGECKPDHTAYMLIDGEDIENAYEEEYGMHSCMSGSESHLVRLYAENACCRMMLYDDGSYKARALMWDTDDGETILDRIYPNSGPHINKIHCICRDKGWLYRADQSLPGGEHVWISDNKKHTITVDVPSHGAYPYVDTFCFAKWKDESNKDKLVLCNDRRGGSYPWVLQSTSGSGPNTHSCYHCGCAVHEDDRLYSERTDEYYCDNCYHNLFTTCECCHESEFSSEVINVHVMRNTCTVGYGLSRRRSVPTPIEQFWCNGCVEDNAFRSDCSGDYFHNDELVQADDGYEFAQSEWDDVPYRHCEECEELLHGDNFHVLDDCCLACCDEREREESRPTYESTARPTY